MGPLAGLLGAGEGAGAAGAVAGDAFMPAALGVGGEGAGGGLLGGAAGAAAGDAYMPGALGADGAGSPSLGQIAGGKFANLVNNPGNALKGGLKGLSLASKAGMFGQPGMAPVAPPHPYSGPPIQNTVVAPQKTSGLTLEELLKLLQQQQSTVA